jgi:hypothetical protein
VSQKTKTKSREGAIKEVMGGVNSTVIQLYHNCIVRTFVNVTVYPQCNNNNNKTPQYCKNKNKKV